MFVIRREASDSKQYVNSGAVVLGKAELIGACGSVKSLRNRVGNARKNV